MSAQTEEKHHTGLSKTCLVSRTAAAIYVASHFHTKTKFTAFEDLHPVEMAKFERMARAALTEALREPVTL